MLKPFKFIGCFFLIVCTADASTCKDIENQQLIYVLNGLQVQCPAGSFGFTLKYKTEFLDGNQEEFICSETAFQAEKSATEEAQLFNLKINVVSVKEMRSLNGPPPGECGLSFI